MECPPKKMAVVERPGRCGEVAVSGGCLFTVIQALLLIIIWPCLKKTGNKQIEEFDWLKSILIAV